MSLFVQRTVAQIPWRSNLSLLDKLSDATSRMWYAREVARNGWSKEWLDICIELRYMVAHQHITNADRIER